MLNSNLKIKKMMNYLKNTNYNLILIWNANPNDPNANTIWNLLISYFQIWPLFQWITSLLTLVLVYWASGYFYNRFLSQKGGWMDAKTRIIMIIIDLLLNFSLGIYYMNYRNTFIGALMLQCPVFCSPIFWVLELICFYIYSKYVLKKD